MRTSCLLVFLAACGTRTPPPPRPRTDELPPLPEVSGPPQPWDDMTYDDRKQYMMRTVRPAMAKMFREFDGEYFADFGCHTCHGRDANERRHEMPNDLPRLFPTGSREQQRTVRDHPRMAKFMFNRVRPVMRDLLGLEDFDPETRTGFGCFNCHPGGEPEP